MKDERCLLKKIKRIVENEEEDGYSFKIFVWLFNFAGWKKNLFLGSLRVNYWVFVIFGIIVFVMRVFSLGAFKTFTRQSFFHFLRFFYFIKLN